MRSASRRDSFTSRPLAHLAAAFACGVLLAHFFSLPLTIVVALCALASTSALLAFARRAEKIASAFVCASFLFAGAAHATAGNNGVAANRIVRLIAEDRIEAGAPVELTGVLAR